MSQSDHSTSKGKGPTTETANNVGFRPQGNMVAVEPPKPEDLQMSYASIVDDHANPKGWYGSMSTSPVLPPPNAKRQPC